MNRTVSSDPLGNALTWVWALGTAAGLAMVGVLAQGESPTVPGSLAHPSLNVDDAAPYDAAEQTALALTSSNGATPLLEADTTTPRRHACSAHPTRGS
ncbi:hypothetical protein SL103_09785 [Streptomyces lydicus]|uniref:Uncharacterized protein n=1 Tax=Streptomyces lydicus TaxID=47763 RepID=A0A1D7VIB5_9ACTN|nr:hypothetical protein SL103_09785 [Streptomyces lydicus]